MKEWKYPSNTIDADTGEPSSTVSWSIAERADKDRYFLEPGFVIGVTIARPKLMLKGTAPRLGICMLDSAMAWLPAIMAAAPQTSMKEYLAGTGPLSAIYPSGSSDYVVDVRDLFVYGDIAHRKPGTGTEYFLPWADIAASGLPSGPTHHQSQYWKQSDMPALFVDNTKPYVLQDGVVSMTVLGTQVDHT